ncbi:hypothetical protein ACSLVK_07195 [Photorhabdus tasmaniensis]|uniref:hypothetical protein n=1 Tax=Photorhabdus TaxID=29487 RepID=UPI0036DEC9B5
MLIGNIKRGFETHESARTSEPCIGNLFDPVDSSDDDCCGDWRHEIFYLPDKRLIP